MSQLQQMRADHDRRQSVNLTLADLRQRVKEQGIENAQLRNKVTALKVLNAHLVATAIRHLREIGAELDI